MNNTYFSWKIKITSADIIILLDYTKPYNPKANKTRKLCATYCECIKCTSIWKLTSQRAFTHTLVPTHKYMKTPT